MANYWTEREDAYFSSFQSHKDELNIRMSKHFNGLKRRSEDDILAFITRYSNNEGISMAQAKKRIDRFDVQEFAGRVQGLLQQGNLTPKAQAELKLYNLTMRTNRLELLRMKLDLESVRTFSNVELDFRDSLFQEARMEFQRQSGILGSTVTQSDQWIRQLANADFYGATWSNRIWGAEHAERLRAALGDAVGEIQIFGRNPRRLAPRLAREFNTATSNAERLLNAEAARVNTGIKKESLTQVGFDEYIYYAEPTACDICKALSGNTYKVSEMQAGVNAKPMHPFCYCGVLPKTSGRHWESE